MIILIIVCLILSHWWFYILGMEKAVELIKQNDYSRKSSEDY